MLKYHIATVTEKFLENTEFCFDKKQICKNALFGS